MTSDADSAAEAASKDPNLLREILELAKGTATKSDMKDVREDVQSLGNRMQRVESCVAHTSAEATRAHDRIDHVCDQVDCHDKTLTGWKTEHKILAWILATIATAALGAVIVSLVG